MSSPYIYTPYLWPLVASIIFLLAMSLYSWNRGSVPGAIPYAIVSLSNAVFMVGVAFEVAAVSEASRIFWFSFRAGIVLVPMTAMLCFAIQYAGLGRHFITRRALIFLSIPPLLLMLSALTNDAHRLLWTDFTVNGYVEWVSGPIEWVFAIYAYLLSAAIIGILVWLAWHSPAHRLSAALVISGVVITRIAYVIAVAGVNPVPRVDIISASMVFAAGVYAAALFGFRMFDPVSVARETVIEQMRDGMLVLDNRHQIADLNIAAEAMLGAPATSLRGCDLAEVLPGWDGASTSALERVTQSEFSLGAGQATRHYTLYLSPLRDRHGHPLGRLLLLHDVTEQKQAQARLLEHQRAVATLQERERLARELHDSAGQVLGYVSMQVQSINKQIRDGELATAMAQLDRLAEVAREAHSDVRESILSLKTDALEPWSFLDALRHYLDTFGQNYGIDTELTIRDGIVESDFAMGAGVQLLRVIQEALTNARKHSGAHCVHVDFAREDGRTTIVVGDNGRGFDTEQEINGISGHFGLDFMRARVEEIGGCLVIDTRSGAGTRVILRVPVEDEREGEE